MPESLAPTALAILRIVAALLFMEHGTQKLLAFPGPFPVAPLPLVDVVAGVLELVGGLLVLAGAWTRWVAFLLSGEMAVAYWTMHIKRGFFPLLNGGDAAILFCFVFLYLAAAGPGPFSWDGRARAANRPGA